MTLESFIVSELFAFLLIFIRVGSGIMIMPGVGESYVSPRIRLPFALLVSLLLVPMVQDQIPPPPISPLILFVLMAGEMIIGLFFGSMARILISTMHTVGMVISFQSSLASATMFDVSQATQGSALGNFLSIMAVLLVFITDMHHLMLQGLIDSYTLFTPGNILPIGDMTDSLSRLASDCFNIALRLAMPVVVMGLLVYLGAGVLARLMPNMQVFFVMIPLQIQISILVMMTSLSGMMLWYMDFLEGRLTNFVGG